MKRRVLYISDGTGITAEALGRSLITQFEQIGFEHFTIPYVDTHEKAQETVERINQMAKQTGSPPIVFATLVDKSLSQILSQSNALYFDFFQTFIEPLEKELHIHSSHKIGRSHSMNNDDSYKARIEAINYTLYTDDGTNLHQYERADVILVGVSRSGKTPTSLYLALQFGIFAANYPITDDDLEHSHDLPKVLKPYASKLFGLTIDTQRLQAIRQERRPNSQYASFPQCQRELKLVEVMFKRFKIPYLNSTTRSIEEISTRILSQLGLGRRYHK